MLKRKHPVIPIHTSGVTWSPYDTPIAKWAGRVGFTAPFVLISIGIRMRNSNKIKKKKTPDTSRPSRKSKRTLSMSACFTDTFPCFIKFEQINFETQISRSRPTHFYFTFHWIEIKSPAIDIVNGCFSLIF